MVNKPNEYGKGDLEGQSPVLRAIGLANGQTLKNMVMIQIFDEWYRQDRQILTFDHHFFPIFTRILSWRQEEWKIVDI
jgi:hypothetical protein